MRHRARGPVCQIPGLRYALTRAIPTGGKATRIRAAVTGSRRGSTAAEKADRGNDYAVSGEDRVRGFAKNARLSIAAALIGLAVPLALAPAPGQGAAQAPSWLDPTLLAAAKAEGTLIVY